LGAIPSPVAPAAQSRFFPSTDAETTIINMELLQMLIRVLADWVRGIVMDVLSRRAEHLVDKWLKKRRLRHGKNHDEIRDGRESSR